MSTFDYVITITDGTTTETLTSSPYGIREYIQNPPDPMSVDTLTDDDSVSETMVIRVMDGSAANNIDEIQSIQRLLDQARKAQNDPTLAKVWITWLSTTGGATYRSEILAGKVEWEDDTLHRANWTANIQKATIYLTRRWYWEASTAVQIALSNDQIADNTSGLAIWNPSVFISADTISFTSGTKTIADSGNGLAVFYEDDVIHILGSALNDGTYTLAGDAAAGSMVVDEALADEAAGADVVIIGPARNHVRIGNDDTASVVDSPIRLELTNASGSAVTYNNIHIGVTHMPSVADFPFIFEGEDGAGTSVTPTDSDTASSGAHAVVEWAGDVEIEAWTIALTSAMLEACRGADFLAIARLDGGTIATSTQLRLRLKLSTTVIWEGALVTLREDDELQELGIIKLPPYLSRHTAQKAFNMYHSLHGHGHGHGIFILATHPEGM
jgi:hypothetical protein